MADKLSTLVVTLNHGCCFKKIRKTVCKLQETEDIRAISYDEASLTVTISGAFDPLVLPCKLRRKVGFLIRDIQLVAAELRLTPQQPVQQRPAMLPIPSAPSCCCGICGCGGYDYGGCHCGCQACGFVNYLPAPPAGYDYRELPLGQYPKSTCDCEEASTCKIM